MAKFRKKPIIIEAFQWTGDAHQTEDPEWIVEAIKNGQVRFSRQQEKPVMIISTLEGEMRASPGEYIIRGVKGEIYPCKKDIFEAITSPVDADDENVDH